MSETVKVILIILLALVSIAVIWIGMRAILSSSSSDITIGKYNSDIKISQVQMMDYEDVNVKVTRTSLKNELEGVRFIVYDKDNKQMTSYHISMKDLEDNNFNVVLSVQNTSNIKKITIAPIVISKSGDQVIGNVQDEYKVNPKDVVVYNPPREDSGYAANAVKYCTYASDCKDDDPCTIGACFKGICSYPRVPECEFCKVDSDCEDNNACTNNLCVYERCSYPSIKGCESCSYDFQCEDNNPCTEDTCIDQGCSYTSIPECISCTSDYECNDNNTCTKDTCSFGRCYSNLIDNCIYCETDIECDDNNLCTNDSCIEGGCQYNKISDCSMCEEDSDCNDNDKCTEDSCSEKLCVYTPLEDCNYCNSNLQCDDSNSCTADICISGECTYTTKSNCVNCTEDLECWDEDECTDDVCLNGACAYLKIEGCSHCVSQYQCEDNNPCTENTCSEEGLCSYLPIPECSFCSDTSRCDDDNPGTADICSNGKCIHPEIKTCISNDGFCPEGCNSQRDSDCAYECGNNIREGSEKCDGSLGGATCAGVLGVAYTGTLKCNSNCTFDITSCKSPCNCVDDGNICTTDRCDNNNVCQHISIIDCCTKSNQCEDNKSSTQNVCSSANKCVYVPITDCADNDNYCPSGCTTSNDNNCDARCGNGYKEGNEQCDDGDISSGDGCSSICTIESGWQCNSASPSVCSKPSCENDCESGERYCTSDTQYKVCGNFDPDICLDWSTSSYTCPNQQSCDYEDGSCYTPAPVCTSHSSSACYNGDVYWYNSCGEREGIRYDCTSTQTCSNGQCITPTPTCTSHSYSQCYNGDVYWYNSCDVREGIRTDCTSTQTCSNGQCVSSGGTTGAIIIDHTTTDITQIPASCIEKAKTLTFQYAHRSDGGNILEGLNYVYSQNSAFRSAYDVDYLPSQTSPIRLRIMEGNPPLDSYSYPELYWNSAEGRSATESNWASGDFDASMWSWCSEFNQGNPTAASQLANSYIATMPGMEAKYPNVKFVYMTSYWDYRDSGIATANQIIRNFAKNNNKILYDFEDIGKCDPDGYCYSNADRECSWCYDWCNSHSSSCTNLPSTCAHTHPLLCAQRAKAFWWMMARIAGWDGVAGHECS